MRSVFNPRLFSRMSREFHSVRVTRAGEEMEAYYTIDPGRGTKILAVVSWGEMYVTNCKYCRDDRGRMGISYRYGEYDSELGRKSLSLWNCFNESCQDKKDCRTDLARVLLTDRLRPGSTSSYANILIPNPKTLKSGELLPVSLPGFTVPLNELALDHPAIQYLSMRGFDPTDLVRTWEVGYCVYVPPRERGAFCQDRIIIPVRHNGMVVGFQGRYCGDLPSWKNCPKYLTYFPKAQTLYGAHQAVATPWVTVVEGPTDVWRYGPGAVATMGKGFSERQLQLLSDLADGRPIVFVPDTNDPNAEDVVLKDIQRLKLRKTRSPIGLCPLPIGTDPGGLTTPDLRYRVAYSLNYLI